MVDDEVGEGPSLSLRTYSFLVEVGFFPSFLLLLNLENAPPPEDGAAGSPGILAMDPFSELLRKGVFCVPDVLAAPEGRLQEPAPDGTLSGTTSRCFDLSAFRSDNLAFSIASSAAATFSFSARSFSAFSLAAAAARSFSLARRLSSICF